MRSTKNKVTMYTIADEVGLSIAAVSRAFDPHSKLKPDKRRLILDTAARLGYVQNKMAARLSRDVIPIGVIVYGAVVEFYSEYILGIRAAHEKYADYKVDCDLRVLRITENSIDEVYAVIDEFIDRHYAGIIISGLNDRSDVKRVNRIREKGIPFIILGSDISGCLRDGVSTNNAGIAGALAAQLLSMAMKEKRKTAVFCDNRVNMTQNSLVEAFLSASGRYDFENVAVYETYNDPMNAYRLAGQMISEHIDIGGIYISSANSVPIFRLLENIPEKPAIVASDVLDALNRYLQSGLVFATIYQDPFHQAHAAFTALVTHILDGDPIPEFILAKPQAVFESNLSLYLR